MRGGERQRCVGCASFLSPGPSACCECARAKVIWPKPSSVHGGWIWSFRISGCQGATRHGTRFAQRDTRKAIEMSKIHRSRRAFSAVVAVFVFALCAPIAGNAEEQVIAEEQVLAAEEQIPVLAPAELSWDESSGYGSVEASRATASALLAPATGPSWDESSGYASVERTRAEMGTLLSGELNSGQEQAAALAAVDAKSWDETSGYGSVEASRAASDGIVTP
jgi:hypothetical protein